MPSISITILNSRGCGIIINIINDNNILLILRTNINYHHYVLLYLVVASLSSIVRVIVNTAISTWW